MSWSGDELKIISDRAGRKGVTLQEVPSVKRNIVIIKGLRETDLLHRVLDATVM